MIIKDSQAVTKNVHLVTAALSIATAGNALLDQPCPPMHGVMLLGIPS